MLLDTSACLRQIEYLFLASRLKHCYTLVVTKHLSQKYHYLLYAEYTFTSEWMQRIIGASTKWTRPNSFDEAYFS
jgi:hypothetical protein